MVTTTTASTVRVARSVYQSLNPAEAMAFAHRSMLPTMTRGNEHCLTHIVLATDKERALFHRFHTEEFARLEARGFEGNAYHCRHGFAWNVPADRATCPVCSERTATTCEQHGTALDDQGYCDTCTEAAADELVEAVMTFRAERAARQPHRTPDCPVCYGSGYDCKDCDGTGLANCEVCNNQRRLNDDIECPRCHPVPYVVHWPEWQDVQAQSR
jgi:hypothetical protein